MRLVDIFVEFYSRLFKFIPIRQLWSDREGEFIVRSLFFDFDYLKKMNTFWTAVNVIFILVSYSRYVASAMCDSDSLVLVSFDFLSN